VKNNITKILSVLLCMATVLILPSIAVSASAVEGDKFGDLNGDGAVTAADAIICLQASSKLTTLTEKQKKAADVFGDGEITAACARKILRVSLGLENFEEEFMFTPQPKNPAVLSAEQEKRIKEDWVATWNQEWIKQEPEVKLKYYGSYNGCIVLVIKDNHNTYPTMVWDENISGVVFFNLKGSGIQVWNNGSFLNLRSAYEQGLLTKEDLWNIEYYHRTGK